MTYIGIDLGTTYSCVSLIENGQPKIVFDETGKLALFFRSLWTQPLGSDFVPSIVSYGNEETLIGNPALKLHNPFKLLYGLSRKCPEYFLNGYYFQILKGLSDGNS